MVLTRTGNIKLKQEQIEELAKSREQFTKTLDGRVSRPFDVTALTFEALIGKGGFGAVYKARNAEGEVFAVKVQEKAYLSFSPQRMEQAQNERTYLLAFDSQFVVKCAGTWRSADHVALVLEHAPRGNILEHLRHSGTFSEQSALYVSAQIVCALEYLHASNVIHGDLKPDNCLLFDKGRLKLCDFGFSRYGLEHAQAFGGTLPYVAPEIFVEHAPYTQMVDWWAFGAMLHLMFLRKFPFWLPGQTAPDVVARYKEPDPLALPFLDASKLGTDTKDLIRSCLIKDTTKRLGGGPGGAQEVMNHRYYTMNRANFVWVKTKDFICPHFQAEEVIGEPCKDPDFLKMALPEGAEPNDFKDF